MIKLPFVLLVRNNMSNNTISYRADEQVSLTLVSSFYLSSRVFCQQQFLVRSERLYYFIQGMNINIDHSKILSICCFLFRINNQVWVDGVSVSGGLIASQSKLVHSSNPFYIDYKLPIEASTTIPIYPIPI